MNRPQRNNNPINLEYRGQVGAVKSEDDRFASFSTPIEGWQAAHRQIKLDQRRGLTFQEFLSKFAPPVENNTNDYIEYVCVQLRVLPCEKLDVIGRHAIAGVMAQMEGYFV